LTRADGEETIQLVPLSDGVTLWTAATGPAGGTVPAVACCHGGPGLWDCLGSLAALIDDNRTVIRFDQRGCGRPTGGDGHADAAGPFTVAQAVDDLDQLREALGYQRWAVLGHSWGAELALRYAARHPDRVTTVVYIAGNGAGDARDLWDTRPPGPVINAAASRQLWADRATDDLLVLASRVRCPVRMICGADDPRPWPVTDPLLAALPDASRSSSRTPATPCGRSGPRPSARRSSRP
jgi:proline iminopeptidase